MKIKILLVFIITLGIFSIWYLTPKKCNVTLDGVYYQLGNEELSQSVKVHLDGKLHNRINGKKTFKGTVEIEGQGVPAIPKDKTEVVFDYHGDNRSPLFSAFRVIDDAGRVVPDIYNYGLIYTNNRFTQFTIALFIDGDSSKWSPINGLMITAPAHDRLEALNTSQKLMAKFEMKLKK